MTKEMEMLLEQITSHSEQKFKVLFIEVEKIKNELKVLKYWKWKVTFIHAVIFSLIVGTVNFVKFYINLKGG